jgi:hypothetical protein
MLDIRREALIRAGMNRAGNAAKTVIDYIDSMIQSKHTELFRRHRWARLKTVLDIDLVEGQTVYEFPDGTYIGLIQLVWAENDAGHTTQMEAAVHPHRFDPYLNDDVGAPQTWWVEDAKFHMAPTPAPDWTKIRISCQGREARIQEPGDRVQVDAELLTRYVVIDVLRHFGKHDVADREQRDLHRFETDVQAHESEGKIYRMGQSNLGYPTQRGHHFRGHHYPGQRGAY